MGGSSSTMKSPEKVFEKELNNIESILNKIITKNDKFVDPSYNFMNDSVCNDYTMVVQDKLNKHQESKQARKLHSTAPSKNL